MTDDPDAARDAEETRRMLEMLKAAVEALGEVFENVQIFVNRHAGDETGVQAYNQGSGNIFAREGQVRDWITAADARTRLAAVRAMRRGS